MALAACGLAAILTILPLGLAASTAVAFLIGAGLGLLTVTTVTYLPLWLSDHNPVLKVGLGTGIGYVICNVPLLFTSSPEVQSISAATLCFGGILVTWKLKSPSVATTRRVSESNISFGQVLICFTALVWFDSAAFFIIQNTPALKAGTWGGSVHLWSNGLLHFAGALASVWGLLRGGLASTLSLAFLALASACLLLLDPNRASLASAFYPVGVSLYSVALVAYPSLLAPVSSVEERGRQAGWIYAIAGWIGSAVGIGMGQNLGHVPPVFLVFTGAVVLSPQLVGILRRRKREAIATLATLISAYAIDRIVNSTYASEAALSSPERGRQVYIAEGCINCHSQYVRPGTADVVLWGPVLPMEILRQERPLLIGNRRQGPDLTQVGNRRSPLWLKAHLYAPSDLIPSSFMPSYRYLFEDPRGDDLVAYLHDLGGESHRRPVAWHPSTAAIAQANSDGGQRLFQLYCTTCHGGSGHTRGTWRTSFKNLPPQVAAGTFTRIPASDSPAERRERLATIVKFGLPGTDMPGHEYLPDREIASISLWLEQKTAEPISSQVVNIPIGEN